MRLDKRLKAEHQELSWRQIREAIEKGQVTVEGQVEKDPGFDVYDDVTVEMNRNRPAQSRARAAFDILHEDNDVIVLNKPAGLLSIPSSPEAASSEDTVMQHVTAAHISCALHGHAAATWSRDIGVHVGEGDSQFSCTRPESAKLRTHK